MIGCIYAGFPGTNGDNSWQPSESEQVIGEEEATGWADCSFS